MLQTREADEWSFYQGTPYDAESRKKICNRQVPSEHHDIWLAQPGQQPRSLLADLKCAECRGREFALGPQAFLVPRF